MEIPGFAKWQVVGFLLLAAENDNKIPYDESFLVGRLGIHEELGEHLFVEELVGPKIRFLRTSGRLTASQARRRPRIDDDQAPVSPLIRPGLSVDSASHEDPSKGEDVDQDGGSDDPRNADDPRIILDPSLSPSSLGIEETSTNREGGETGDLFGGPPDTPEAEALVVLADYWEFRISDRDWRWFAAFCRQWEAKNLDVGVAILSATTRKGIPKSWRRALTAWLEKTIEFRERDARDEKDAAASSWTEELPTGVDEDEARAAWAWYRSTESGAGYRGDFGSRQTQYVVAEFRKQESST